MEACTKVGAATAIPLLLYIFCRARHISIESTVWMGSSSGCGNRCTHGVVLINLGDLGINSVDFDTVRLDLAHFRIWEGWYSIDCYHASRALPHNKDRLFRCRAHLPVPIPRWESCAIPRFVWYQVGHILNLPTDLCTRPTPWAVLAVDFNNRTYTDRR